MLSQGGRTWGVTFLGNTLIVLCGIATGILAARLLLPEGRGALAAILFWPQLIAGIGIMSLHEAVTFRVAAADLRERQRILASSMVLALLLAAAAVLAGYMALPWLLGPDRVEWLPVARQYFLAFVPFNFVALSLLAVDHGRQDFVRYNLLRLLPSLVYLTGLVTLWVTGNAHVVAVVWAIWLGTSLTTALRLLLAARDLKARPSLAEAARLLRVGTRFHLTALLVLLGAQADRVVVISFWDDVAVGFYSVALTVAMAALGIITQTFHTVMFPRISAAPNDGARREITARGLRYASLLLVVGTGLLIAVTPWLIPFLFGQPFQGAVGPAMVLLVAYLPLALRQIIARSLRGAGEARPGTVAEAIALLTFFALFWPLAQVSGLVGISLALLAANVVALIHLSGYLKARLELTLRHWWGFNTSTIESALREVREMTG